MRDICLPCHVEYRVALVGVTVLEVVDGAVYAIYAADVLSCVSHDRARRALSPSEEPPKPTILYRPLAVAAGLFESQGHTVRIAGIEAIVPADGAFANVKLVERWTSSASRGVVSRFLGPVA